MNTKLYAVADSNAPLVRPISRPKPFLPAGWMPCGATLGRFGCLKDGRRVAARCDGCQTASLSAVALATTVSFWLQPMSPDLVSIRAGLGGRARQLYEMGAGMSVLGAKCALRLRAR